MQDEGIYKTVVDQLPLKRHAELSEMVCAVRYLVSDAASYTTGARITCDGGLLALPPQSDPQPKKNTKLCLLNLPSLLQLITFATRIGISNSP